MKGVIDHLITLIFFTLSLALTVTGVISLIIGNLKKRNDIIKHGIFKAALGIAIFIIIKRYF
ncbi:UNVERIFIED_CONTAM: hypothetical protein KB569_05190 [Streptococcus canis]